MPHDPAAPAPRRRLVAVLPGFDAQQQARLTAAAAAQGFEALLFEEDAAALPWLEEAEIVLSQSAALARRSPRLRWFCTPSAGVDHLVREERFRSPDVALTNSSGAYGVTIAEHTVMVILEVLRRQADYAGIVTRREWRRDLPVRSIKGSRILLLGTGDIGRETALRLRAFGPARLTGVSRRGLDPDGLFDRAVPVAMLDSLLPETDILIISLPGTPQTHRLLDADRLARLPGGALLVNVGRGSVLDQQALAAELRAGRLCAALDVFETEPIPPADPLWACPNLLITPHVAGNMTLPYTRERILSLFLEDFENYCAGRPLRRRVDPQRGY